MKYVKRLRLLRGISRLPLRKEKRAKRKRKSRQKICELRLWRK